MSTRTISKKAPRSSRGEEITYKTLSAGSSGLEKWDTDSLIDLIIKQYHSTAKKNVVVIYDLAQEVFSRDSDNNPELGRLVEALFLFFDDLLFHLKKEEQILFPNIIQLSKKKRHDGSSKYSTFGVLKDYAHIMQNEHREVVKQLEFFRELTNNYSLPETNSKTYKSLFAKMKEFERDLIQHIQLENNFLFPRAIMMDEN